MELRTRSEVKDIPVIDRHSVPADGDYIASLPRLERARRRCRFISTGALRLVHRDQRILLPEHLACLAQGQHRHERFDPATPQLPHGTVGHPIEDRTVAD
jgi:hypothetical protein